MANIGAYTFVLFYFWRNFVGEFSGIMFIVMLSYKIHSKFLSYLGRNTMIIFAWHSRIIIVLCGYLYSFWGIFQNDTFLDQCMYSFVTLLIVFIVLIPINEIIKKSKIHAIFGV